MSQEAKLKAVIIGWLLAAIAGIPSAIWYARGTVKDVEANTEFRKGMEPVVKNVIYLDAQMEAVKTEVGKMQDQMDRIEDKIDRLQ